jgi:hypothetical protein
MGDFSIDGRSLKKEDVRVWTGFNWLRTGFTGKFL